MAGNVENVSSVSPGEPENYDDFTIAEDLPVEDIQIPPQYTLAPAPDNETKVRELLGDLPVDLIFDTYGSVTIKHGLKAESIHTSVSDSLIRRAATRVLEK